MKILRKILLCGAAALILSGCATRPDLSEYPDGADWNITLAEKSLSGDDPIEPFNRSMFAVNHFLMRWLVRPVSWVYCSILPKEVIVRIDNVSDNLAFPGRMVSCLLQAKWKGAGISLSRFLINSTVGIAGIFDPADYYLHFSRRHENMGHAFATWGIGPGCVLILPFSKAVNVRDQVGALFDSALDLKIVIPYAGYVAGLNRTVSSYDPFDKLVQSAADPYEQFKLAMVLLRFPQLKDYIFPEEPADLNFCMRTLHPGAGPDVVETASVYKPYHPLVDTMRAGLFTMQNTESRWWTNTSLWNRDFQNLGKIREVRDPEEPESAEPRRYQFWNVQENKEKPVRKKELVILIPGVGTHFTGGTLRALAEVYSDAGYAVITTSSTMNWEFATTKETAFPGYVPEDVRHLRRHLKLILKDVAERDKFIPERTVIAGYSLGGLQTLHLAAEESRENTLGASRYVAINPPVDLVYAMERFEQLGHDSGRWNSERFFNNLGIVTSRYIPLVQEKHPHLARIFVEAPTAEKKEPEHDYVPKLTPHQAGKFIFISFRMILRELLLSDARNGFLDQTEFPYSWGRRLSLYEKIDSVSGPDYVKMFILKKFPDLTYEQLRFNSGLRSLEPFLRQSPEVRVFHNLDDPLLSQEDADFLSSVLGKKLIWFDHGGHLGNLYLKDYHDLLLKASGNP